MGNTSDSNFEKVYNSALKFLSYRPRSEKEVREKLKALMKRHSGSFGGEFRASNRLSRIDSGVVPLSETPQNDSVETTIEKIIAKLKEQKFINDEEFTKSWIENRIRFKPRSLRLIKIELKQKGIDSETIDSLQLTVNSDLEQAKKLVEKSITRFRNKFGMTREEIYQKLGRFLASKGFDWDTIKKSIDEVLGKGI